MLVSPDDTGLLVRGAAGGDEAAWRGLVTRFSSLVWAVARAHRLTHADAADVYQTTWLRLAEHIGRIEHPERIGAWLATAARRECLQSLRLAAKAAPTDDMDRLDNTPAVVNPTEEAVLAAVVLGGILAATRATARSSRSRSPGLRPPAAGAAAGSPGREGASLTGTAPARPPQP